MCGPRQPASGPPHPSPRHLTVLANSKIPIRHRSLVNQPCLTSPPSSPPSLLRSVGPFLRRKPADWRFDRHVSSRPGALEALARGARGTMWWGFFLFLRSSALSCWLTNGKIELHFFQHTLRARVLLPAVVGDAGGGG